MDDNTAFWMVWNPQGHAPTVRHTEEMKAVKEAERLARINPGQEFFILFAQAKYVRTDVRCIRLEPEMPF